MQASARRILLARSSRRSEWHLRCSCTATPSLSSPPPPAPSLRVCLAVMGPSGVGKDSVLRGLVSRRRGLLHAAVNATTRPPRKGEVGGVDYHFVSRDEFDAWQDQGLLLEHVQLYGERFGLLRSEVEGPLAGGRDVAVRVDWRGLLALRAAGLRCRVVSVCLVPEHLGQIQQQMAARGAETAQAMQQRQEVNDLELPHMLQHADHILVNKAGLLEECVRELDAILTTAATKVAEAA